MTSLTKILPEPAVEAFARGFTGEIIRPGDPSYDRARRVWNGMIDRRPALIARPRTAHDTQAGIALAADHGLPLAVRGGGHNVAGTATCDGGVVLDLCLQRAIRIDPTTRTVRVQGGATWGEVDRITGQFGLATTGGMISTTGVAGLTLGGGVGWLMRAHGLACDNLVHATVVTAHDSTITASTTNHPDLFTALRGGGGNFGVVTELGFRLHPVHTVLGGHILYPIDRAVEVLEFFDQFCAEAPDTITTLAAFITAPPTAPVPDHLWHRPVVLVALCAIASGAQLAAPLRHFGPPAVDLVRPMTYPQLQTLLDATAPAGRRNYWKPGYIAALPRRTIETFAEHIAAAPSPHTQIVIHQMGGAVTRAHSGHTAVSHRHARYLVNLASSWEDPSDDDHNTTWTRDLWARIEPDVTGAYVNYLSSRGTDDVGTAYGPGAREHLTQAKDRWDPTNIFRLNHNISPHAT